MKFLLLMTMLLSLSCCGYGNGKKPEGAFKYYEYRSTTMREYPHEYYRLEYSEENGLTLSWAKCNSPVAVVPVPDSAAQEVASLIKQYKLYKLKRTYRPPFDVRDGIMWHVYFCFGDDHTSCSADNAWPPDKLKQGIQAINDYLNTLIE